MIKFYKFTIQQFTRSQKYTVFNWFKKKEEEQVEDDSAYDPKTWKPMQQVMDAMRLKNQSRPKLLPPKAPLYPDKLTVVMEMDEVLLYSFVPDEKDMFINAPIRRHDYHVELPEYDYFVQVYKREHLDEFMKYFLSETEPVIWSRGARPYVERVMEKVCPEFPKTQIFCQEDCNLVEEEDIDEFVKDVDLLGRDRKRLVYVDSKPLSFWTFGDNSIPIKMFVADNTQTKDDLLKLMEVLDSLKSEVDVRKVLSKKYKVEETLRESKLID